MKCNFKAEVTLTEFGEMRLGQTFSLTTYPWAIFMKNSTLGAFVLASNEPNFSTGNGIELGLKQRVIIRECELTVLK